MRLRKRFPARALARRAGVLAVAAMVTALGVVGPTHPAGAHHQKPYHVESDMVDDTSSANRDTFTLDPGAGNLATRGTLLANAGLYEHYGFSRNFLWYAEEKVRVVDEGEGWSSCTVAHVAAACPIGKVEIDPSHTVGTTFGGSTSLHLLEWDGAFIAQGCGNFSTERTAKPVPTIRGVKFRDANRNGHQDPGEARLPGWHIRVTRIGSQVGQGTGVVADLSTDGNGAYSFRLDGHGPGTYRVQEIVPAGWQNYTAASEDVTVGFGVGAPTHTVDFGNAETTTDVAKTAFHLVDPPTRFEKDQPADLTVHSEVTNHGPAGPIEVDEQLTVVEKPGDCTIEGLPPRRRRTLDVGQTVVFDDVVTVTCSHRSDHRFVFGNDVAVASPAEVTDVDPTNDHATIDVTIPVFEPTTLAIDDLTLVCSEYWAADPFTCSATARVANTGAAEDARLLATLALAGGDTCTVLPGRDQPRPVTLDGGESTVVGATWSVACPEADLHTFRLDAAVRVDEPHLEAEPRSATLVWVPLDIKPDSDPNSLNVGRPGLVSVALLSTATLDTTTAVDAGSLRFGPTGVEAPVVRCGVPEDADHDGRLDLVCKFQLADAGFAVGDPLGVVTGLLVDGTPFMAADRVRIT
jgi:hypothetical protein